MHSTKPLLSLVLALILLAALACRTEATPTPVPTPMPTAEPTATAVPTATPAPTPTPTPAPTPFPTPPPRPTSPRPIPWPEPYWYEYDVPTDFYGKPVYGGRLRIAYEDPLEHANIWGAAAGAAARYRVPTGATLVMENPYDPREPIVPDLAEEWTNHESLDGVTFHFREGVTWHSGDPFVCEDARFSFETMITGEGLTSSYMKGRLSNVVLEEMACLDDLTLQIRLSEPTAIALHPFAHRNALVFNKAWFLEGGEDAMFQDVSVGIGPFRWAEGQSVGINEQRFERNHDYFIPELPYVDELVIYGILDDSARQAAHLAHQTDWLWVWNAYGRETWYQQYQEYVDHDQIVTVIGHTRGNLRLWINPRHQPFGNARIRQAIVMGIDRQAFIKEIGGGHATVGGFGYAPGSPWEVPREQRCSVPGWCVSENMEATRAEARAILEAEGFDFEESYTILTEDFFAPPSYYAFLGEQLELLGIRVQKHEFMWQPGPTYRPDYPDIMGVAQTVYADDPSAGVAHLLRCDSPHNHWTPEGPCDESIEALLDEAQVETDPDKRLALAHEIELAAMKQYSSFPIYWEQEAAAFWPEVRGYVHFSSSIGSFLKFMHMWIDPAHINDNGYAGQTSGVPGGM